MAARKLTDADWQRIIWLVHHTTIPLVDIGNLYGISQPRITNYLRERALPTRREIARLEG